MNKKKRERTPLRKFILDLRKKDKEFLENERDSLETEFFYNFKDYNDNENEMNMADKEATDEFISALSEHFKINLYDELKNINSNPDNFIEELDKIKINLK